MRYAVALLLALAGCATPAPVVAPVAPPAPIAAAPAAAAAPVLSGTVPPAVAVPVLHQAAEREAEATRYVAWSGSHAGNIRSLTELTNNVSTTTAALQASRRHGRYSAADVRRARAAVDALAAFLANKGD